MTLTIVVNAFSGFCTVVFISLALRTLLLALLCCSIFYRLDCRFLFLPHGWVWPHKNADCPNCFMHTNYNHISSPYSTWYTFCIIMVPLLTSSKLEILQPRNFYDERSTSYLWTVRLFLLQYTPSWWKSNYFYSFYQYYF